MKIATSEAMILKSGVSLATPFIVIGLSILALFSFRVAAEPAVTGMQRLISMEPDRRIEEGAPRVLELLMRRITAAQTAEEVQYFLDPFKDAPDQLSWLLHFLRISSWDILSGSTRLPTVKHLSKLEPWKAAMILQHLGLHKTADGQSYLNALYEHVFSEKDSFSMVLERNNRSVVGVFLQMGILVSTIGVLWRYFPTINPCLGFCGASVFAATASGLMMLPITAARKPWLARYEEFWKREFPDVKVPPEMAVYRLVQACLRKP